MKQPAKMPTLLGLFFLLLGIAVAQVIVQRQNIFAPKASPEQRPEEVRITNITDKSLSISWITSQPSQGFVAYGKTKSLGATLDSDQSAYVHHLTIDNLAANTTYFFKVNTGSATSSSKLYSVKTGQKISLLPTSDIVFGTLFDQQNRPVSSTLIYLTAPGITPLSAVTDVKGKWTIPFSQARKTDLSSWATYDKNNTLVEIFAQAGNGKFSSAKVATGATRPVPAMQLGQSHDFTNLKPLEDGKAPVSELDISLGQTPSPALSTPPSPVSGFSKTIAQAKAVPSPSPASKKTLQPSPALSPVPKASSAPSPKPSPKPSPIQAMGGTSVNKTTEGTLPSAGNLTATAFVFIMGIILVVVGLFVPQTA